MKSAIREYPLDSLVIDPWRRLSRPAASEDRGACLEERFPGFPLIVVDRTRRVIWGECLVEHLRLAEVGSTTVMEVSLSSKESLFLGFNLLQAVFRVNLYEKLHFAALALEESSADEIRRRTGLDIPLNPSLIAQLPLLLDREFAPLLREGRIALPAARELISLPEDARPPLRQLLESVHFTAAQGLKLISMIREILARDGSSAADIFSRAEFQTALSTARPAEAILKFLHVLRFPMATEAEKEWAAAVDALDLPRGMRVLHAPFFEPPGQEIIWKLPDMKALKKLARVLHAGYPTDRREG